MAVAGIICEYNPFHLGHARQLKLLREAMGEESLVVGVMSGNYVQRGMPAAWDKYARAAAAVAAGVDLVLELPLTGVLSSAEGFARAGVEVLHRLGAVDTLCFGAECGEAAAFQALAELVDGEDYRQALRQGLDAGLSYAAAREKAAGSLSALLRKPNAILGVEYCRALRTLGASIKPLVIHRGGDYHALAPDAKEPSATALRAMLPEDGWKDFVPVPVAEILGTAVQYDVSYGQRALLARLRGLNEAGWASCAHGSEGLWRKAMAAVREADSFEALCAAVKSKRYPMTRIHRLLLCAYLGVTAADLRRPIPYARILAFGHRGQALLRTLRKTSTLPLVNPGQQPADRDYYALEVRASDLFTLFAAPGAPTPAAMEQRARIFLEKK